MGTTVRVASMRDDGQTFHDSRTQRKNYKNCIRANFSFSLFRSCLDMVRISCVFEDLSLTYE